MTNSIKWEDLTKPFPRKDISFRLAAISGSQGLALAYIDARAVMDRLDVCCGVGSWQAKYPFPGCCELSINLDGVWITKANCAGETKIEAEKGMASDAFKRAAVLFGIGRYLYHLDSCWVPVNHKKEILELPKLPGWAILEGDCTEHKQKIGALPNFVQKDTSSVTRAPMKEKEEVKESDFDFTMPTDGYEEDMAGDVKTIGNCPKCENTIVQTPKAYSCSSWKETGCNFTIWKTMSGRPIIPQMARDLISEGKTQPITGFVSSKSGKQFSASLILDSDKKVVFDFAAKR